MRVNAIKGKDLFMAEVGSWFPMAANINSISFCGDKAYDNKALECHCTVIPSKKPDKEIEMLLRGVKNVDIRASDYIDCVLLEIIDVSHLQLNKVNWFIGDFKIDSIFLQADSIEITSVQNRTGHSI